MQLSIACLIMTIIAGSQLSTDPTAENALAADMQLAKALQNNDSAGIYHLLDKEWAVISTRGGLGEGPSIFPDGIRTGYLTRKTYELSEPRVRLFGDIALVTTKVKTSGMFAGKSFDVKERQTDTWLWKNGAWKCILTHESNLGMFEAAGNPKFSTGPTAENALAADQQFAMALQNNDSLGIVRMLDKDWAVITSHGDIAEGLDVFPSGIRSGHRMLNAQEVSEPRVRLFGNLAVVTSKVRIVVRGIPGEFNERQTDTWLWKNGAWKCILTQESDLEEGNQMQSMGHYWFVMFSKGSTWGQDSARTAKLFQEHIHYIISQRKTGKIITGGAFLDEATWIGFEIYSCKTSEEVEKITEADPAVSSKIFSYEIHPWGTLKGEVKFQ